MCPALRFVVAGFAFAAAPLQHVATAQECVDYAAVLRVVGQRDIPGGARNVAVHDGWAYVAAGDSGLVVFDLSTPEAPRRVTRVETPSHARDVVVAGSYAYVANWSAGLVVVDIAVPSAAHLVGTADTPSFAHAVEVLDGYAYVADYASGLQVVDVASAESPRVVGSVSTQGAALSVAGSGNQVAVTAGLGNVHLFDVTERSTPRLQGTTRTPGTALGVAIQGAYTYVADGNEGLQVIRNSTRRIVGNVETPGTCNDVVVNGSFAYAADGGLQIIDLSQPLAPRIVGAAGIAGNASAIAAEGDVAYVVEWGADLHVVDITTRAPILATASMSYAGCIVIAEPYAYVAGASSFAIYDLTNPVVPVRRRLLSLTHWNARAVVVQGSFAYVATGTYLKVIDVADVGAARVVSSLELPESAWDLAVSGSYAYVATRNAGLQVVDVSQPETPVIAAAIPDEPIHAVDVAGHHVYMAGWSNNRAYLKAVDVAVPAAPRIVDTIALRDFPQAIQVDGPHAYIAQFSRILQIIDVQVPADMRAAGTVSVLGTSNDVFVAGSLAYVAADGSGVGVVDVSGPGAARFVGAINTSGRARAVALSSTHAYVADGLGGLVVIPQHCTSTPVFLTHLDLEALGDGVEVRWSLLRPARRTAFRVEAARGAQTWPVEIETAVGTEFVAHDRCVCLREGGQIVYTLRHRNFGATWRVLAERSITLEQTLQTQLWAPLPNPLVWSSVVIPVTLASRQQVRVDVYDARGRRVARVFDGRLGAGTSRLHWWGTDESGRRVTAGVYWVRLETASGRIWSRKLVVAAR